MSTNTQTKVQKLFSVLAVVVLLAGLNFMPASTVQGREAGTISVLVQGKDAATAAKLVEKYGGIVTSRLEIIQGVGAKIPAVARQMLQSEPGITRVTTNSSVAMTGDLIDENKPAKTGSNDSETIPASDYPDVTGADQVWSQGVTGNNVTIAIVDTGIGVQQGVVKNLKGSPTRIVAWKDFVENKKNPTDPNGHGTHVAGIIANTQVGTDGEWDGMAPGVDLVGVRVLDETGNGTYENVIQGIQWVVDNRSTYHIRVINLSLEATVESPYWADPLNIAVMQAWKAGIVVVVAAGNNGPSSMSIGVPGNNPYALTVGAFTDRYTPLDWSDDVVAEFSSAGPTLDGFVKPDVMAPGAHMVSTMMPNTYLMKNTPAGQVASQYYSMAGTSQAAAVVTGISALVLAKNGNLTPDEVKFRLMATALPWLKTGTQDALYSMWQQGAGRVNAVDAVFGDLSGKANAGLDVAQDLSGQQHFEGYSYFDDVTQTFRLRGDYSSMADSFGAWSGSFGAWSGSFGAWSGSFGAWSGSFGAWSGSFGAWSGSFGAWSGSFGAWSGSFGAWSGGYLAWADSKGAWSGSKGAWSGSKGAWSGSKGAWSGSVPWATSAYASDAFIASFITGSGPDAAKPIAIGGGVTEP